VSLGFGDPISINRDNLYCYRLVDLPLGGRAILDPVRRRCVRPAPDPKRLQALMACYELVLLAGWLTRLPERCWMEEEWIGDVDAAMRPEHSRV
jgi:hypothetical protein